MKDISFFLVSGFISSGSSAVVDLLKEFKDTYECGAEIRLIKDPYGIMQLENALTDRWELINSAAAIRDFRRLCRICSRSGGGRNPFARAGLSYSKTIHPDFMEITERYISRLRQFTYNMDCYYTKFKKNYLSYVLDRLRLGIEVYSRGKLPVAKKVPMEFAHPTHDQFDQATQAYFEELYAQMAEKNGAEHIILDQAVSPNNPDVIHRYFKKAKLIIVDRDPRDMYVDDIVNWGERQDDAPETAQAGSRYVLRQLALRERIPEDADVMYVRFEELILNYDATVSAIGEFLGFDASMHIRKGMYLKPERSAKNIGIWKQHYEKYRDALDVITSQLPHLCYEGASNG